MKRAKLIMARILSSVMILGSICTSGTEIAQAKETNADSGKVYSIYKAFIENGRDTDTEFGTAGGTLNSSLSPRVIELRYQENPENNGKMYATFECNRLPKTDAQLVSERQGNADNINDSLSGFPIYESLDGGATWGAGEIDTPARGNNYVPVGYVQNQGAESDVTGMRNCPQLYEMPETIGDLEKGTILCAGNSIQAGENQSAADVTQSTTTYLDLCVSDDLGRTWEHHSTIFGPITGQCKLLENTVWEPFFLTFGGRLYCFYSDEAIDDTTDQDISYIYYDGENWSEKEQVVYTKGARPGMPVVSQLKDGRFILTFELNGGGQSGYILSAPNDPTQWYAADGSLKSTVSYKDAVVINRAGAPYNITTSEGTLLYDNTGLSQIWKNTGEAPDEEGAYWISYHTGLNSAYNRQIMELSDGKIFVVGGWNGTGINCVTLDYEMNSEMTGSLESKIGSNDSSVYMAYNGTPMFTWTGTDGHAEPNQFYEFRETEQGNYVLVSTNNGKAMQIQSDSEGSQVDTADIDFDDKKQQWIFEAASDGWYYVKNVESGLYLTTPRTNVSDNMQNQYLTMESKRENADSQLWKPSVSVNAGEQKPEITEEGWLNNGAAENMYLSVDGGTSEDGEEIITWTGIDGQPEKNQIWKFSETEEKGVYRIINTNSGMAISSQNRVEGQRLVQKAVDEADETQLWSFVDTGKDNKYRIWNNSTRFYLTADVPACGSRVLQKNYEESDLQLWVTDGQIITKEIEYDYSIDIVRKDGVSVTYSVDDNTGKITFTVSPREYYNVKNIDLEINGTKLGNGSERADGSVEFIYTPEQKKTELTVHATADVVSTDYYIFNPENDYTGRNQCLSPRVVEGLDGELYATFENGTPSEIQPDEYSFPIYRSDDKGKTWRRVGEILNDDTIHPDSYYKITGYTYTGAPSTVVEVEEGEEGAVRHPWSMQNCPQLFVLPEDTGDMKAGTLICAGVAVPVEEGAEEVSDAGYGGLWDSSLDLYYSTDGGKTWEYSSTIAEGGANGRNIMGYDPVWEPFFVYYEDTLICYYSDETMPEDNGGQVLVYKTSKDGGVTWSDTTTIVDTNARPGMPVVSQMANGQWILTYETVGWSPIKAGYKIADNPFEWENVSDWGDTLPGIGGTYGGSPYVYTLDDGRIVAGTGSLSEVFVNTREDGTGEWIACRTDAPAGYNRCYLQLSSGEFIIAGTEGPGFAGQDNKIFVKVMDPEEVFSAVPTFDSIKVTDPLQTEYKVGEDLNTEGMVTTAVYSDGTTREISKEAYSVTGYDKNTAGDQKVTVTYAGKTDTFTVTVKKDGQEPEKPFLTGIKITDPIKTEYKIGEELDLTGMTVKAVYSDGKEAEITEGYSVEGFDSKTAGEKEIVVTYQGKTAVFRVNVIADEENPDGSGQEKPENTNNAQNNNNAEDQVKNFNTPKTGDNSQLMGYAAILLACVGIAVLIVQYRVRKNK